jgi:hypothetical protein
MIKVYVSLLTVLIIGVVLFFTGRFSFQDKSIEMDEGPSDWFIAQRSYPYGKVDYDAYREALSTRQALIAARNERDILVWESEGPVNIGGRIQDVEMDPLNTQVIYIGAASGGVFKSSDGGNNWQPIFDDQPSLSIGDIAIASA